MTSRLHSDRMAKAGAVSVVLIVVIAGVAVAAFTAFSLFNSRGDTYEISIDVTAMEISSESGSVYNVMKGDRYYNPETNYCDLISKSKIAYLYTSATMGSRTNYSDTVKRTVQETSDVPSDLSDRIEGNTIRFRTSSASSDVTISFFLLLKGSSSAGDGTVIDIYSSVPGPSGIAVTVDLRDHSEELSLTGNVSSEIKGLLKATITVKSV